MRDGAVFLIQFVEEERIDDLLDVRHTGVVHAQTAAQFGRDHRLNHRTEDVGIDLGPVQCAALQDEPADASVHARHLNPLREQTAVDVGKLCPPAVDAVVLLEIHRAESPLQKLLQVGAVLTCGVVDGISKEVFLEDARVFGKVAE